MAAVPKKYTFDDREETPEEGAGPEFRKLFAAARDLPEPTPYPGGPLRKEKGHGIVLSAPHQAAHMREGVRLPAESGSAELAFALARNVGGSALSTVDPQSGDPNWDVGHPYCDLAYELAGGSPVLDFHKMKPRGVDMCVGLGPHPEMTEKLWVPLVKEAVAAGLRVAINWPFKAAGPGTVTGQLQERGLSVVQIELVFHSYEAGPTRVATWTSLLRAIRSIKEASR
ncbi:MAG TPA: hypothetical protein VGH27_03350 [Streptosporangiaceae bacterium]|jgi:hypothetical protein